MSARSRLPSDDETTDKVEKTEGTEDTEDTEDTETAEVLELTRTARPARARSEPLRVISMRAATENAASAAPAAQVEKPARAIPKVKLRAIADVTKRQTTTSPARMGNLAPPRDPRQVRMRRRVDNVVWGCIAVVLASCVTLAIWLLAR